MPAIAPVVALNSRTASLEKLGYGLAVIVLLGQGRVAASALVTAGIDLVLGALFVAAYLKTPSQAPAVVGST
jgi:hypothetical protein